MAMAPNLARRNILVVDDEPLMRWAMAETLADAGYAVTATGSAWETRQYFAGVARVPDVVLLDFRLPDSSDLELLADIRRRAPASAVFMPTAFATPELIRRAQTLGAVVLDKPLDMQALIGLVNATVQLPPS